MNKRNTIMFFIFCIIPICCGGKKIKFKGFFNTVDFSFMMRPLLKYPLKKYIKVRASGNFVEIKFIKNNDSPDSPGLKRRFDQITGSKNNESTILLKTM